jgi:ankyrin repeat protein
VKYGLTELIEKYRRSPEFIFVNLTDPNQKGMTGDTLLHAAAVRGVLEDIGLLVASGASVNAVGDLGNTALHHAASRGMVDIVNKLLESGADVKIKNEFGQTALDVAMLMKRSQVVKILKAHKVRT